MNSLETTALLGVAATATMDALALALNRTVGTTAPNYRLVGRWIAHMPSGRFRHSSIGSSATMPAENLIGWTTHYLVGIAFAGLLLAICGVDWIRAPTPGPAFAVGIATVAAPFALMQPAMGLGFASSRTAHPAAARSRSLLNHALFGLGLYVAGLALSFAP